MRGPPVRFWSPAYNFQAEGGTPIFKKPDVVNRYKVFSSTPGQLAFIFLLSVALYCLSWSAPFHPLDDNYSILNNDLIKDIKNIPRIMTSGYFGANNYYRPLVSLTYMLEYHLFGLDPYFYRLDNLLLHYLSSVVVYFLIQSLTGRKLYAFATAFLFAVHPIQVEAVATISGRAILLCAFFIFSAFLFYVKAQQGGYLRNYVWSIICYVLSLLCKESAMVFPAVLLCFIFFYKKMKQSHSLNELRGMSLGIKGQGRAPFSDIDIVPYFVVLACYLAWRQTIGMTGIYSWYSWQNVLLGFASFLRGVLTYGRLIFFPTDLYFDRGTELFIKFSNPALLMTVGVYVLAFVIFIRQYKRVSPLARFLIFWFWLELAPVSQVLVTIGTSPGYISTAEHFLYVPSVAAFLLAVISFEKIYNYKMPRRHWVSPQAFVTGLVSWTVFLVLINWQQNIIYSHPFTLFKRSIEINPHNTRILHNVGLEYAYQQNYEKAYEYFKLAVAENPWYVPSRIAVGKALCDLGRYEEGARVYESISDAGSYTQMLQDNMKSAYSILLESYQLLVQENPDDVQALYKRGVAYARTGETRQAVAAFYRALELDPHHAPTLYELGVALEQLGDYKNALQYLERLRVTIKMKEGEDPQLRQKIEWIKSKI